ncbi:MAG: hypothetical protein ACUVTY_05995 [Armatimonadota bacterium]
MPIFTSPSQVNHVGGNWVSVPGGPSGCHTCLGQHPVLPDLLAPYVKNEGIFQCPTLGVPVRRNAQGDACEDYTGAYAYRCYDGFGLPSNVSPILRGGDVFAALIFGLYAPTFVCPQGDTDLLCWMDGLWRLASQHHQTGRRLAHYMLFVGSALWLV